MTLRLFFDTTDDGSPVTNYTDQLLGLMEIDTSLPGSNENTNNARPPWVQFNWGSMHSFKAVIASASVSFTYFSNQGVPLRADVDLTLTQYEDGKVFGAQNPHRAPRTLTAPTGCNQARPWTASRLLITATRPIGGL